MGKGPYRSLLGLPQGPAMRSPCTAANYFKETGGGPGLFQAGHLLGEASFKGVFEAQPQRPLQLGKGRTGQQGALRNQQTVPLFTTPGLSLGCMFIQRAGTRAASQTEKIKLFQMGPSISLLSRPGYSTVQIRLCP